MSRIKRKKRTTVTIAASPILQSYGVEEFCAAHCIGRSKFYSMLRSGEGPRTYRIGDRQFVTAEDAASWRAATAMKGAVAA